MLKYPRFFMTNLSPKTFIMKKLVFSSHLIMNMLNTIMLPFITSRLFTMNLLIMPSTTLEIIMSTLTRLLLTRPLINLEQLLQLLQLLQQRPKLLPSLQLPPNLLLPPSLRLIQMRLLCTTQKQHITSLLCTTRHQLYTILLQCILLRLFIMPPLCITLPQSTSQTLYTTLLQFTTPPQSYTMLLNMVYTSMTITTWSAWMSFTILITDLDTMLTIMTFPLTLTHMSQSIWQSITSLIIMIRTTRWNMVIMILITTQSTSMIALTTMVVFTVNTMTQWPTRDNTLTMKMRNMYLTSLITPRNLLPTPKSTIMVLQFTTITMTITTLMFPTLVGKSRPDVLLVNHFQTAQKVKTRMELFVSTSARLASQESDLSAGRIVLMIKDSATTELTATNLMPMAEVLVRFTSAAQAAKSGANSSMSSVTRNSIMLAAVSAHPTAPPR